RTFNSVVAGAGAAPLLAQPRLKEKETEPFPGLPEFTRTDIAPKVHPFPMTDVRVTGGVFKDAENWNRAYMSRLAADRLLYNFRANAGLDLKGAEPLGGWELPADGKHGTELRGHFTGHFLSASAQLYASTGDKAAKDKADYMVAELAKVQEKLGGGYLSAFPTELFGRLDALSGKPRTGPPQPGEPQLPWAPFYTIHKIFAGLLDMHTLAGNQQALEVAKGLGNWVDNWSASKPDQHMQEILSTEFGGVAESLYNLAALTNDDRYARAGDRFQKRWFLNPLALHRDELRGLHVNTHVPQVIAAARRYEISGDTRFRTAADYFFWEVSTARSYVTEGTSNGELWRVEPRRLAAELKLFTSTAECCCSYNMLKLARHLYSWDPQPHYFDYYERALLNHRIGTIQPETGHTQYYLSLTPGAFKTFGYEDKSFWCCTGTGVEEYSKLNDSIYWRDDRGVFVNLFIPSELNWTEKGLRLKQETNFPHEERTALVITAAKPVATLIRLRIPSWAEGAEVRVNGRALEATAEPGSYLTVHRTWKTGDRIELTLPMRLTVEKMPDDPKMQAFLYGPLVLAGDLGTEGLDDRLINGPSGPPIRRPESQAPPNRPLAPPIEVPSFRAAAPDPASWIKPAGQPLTFRTAGQKQDVTLVPFNSLFGRRYSVYWEVS
ncbi:MAG: glycoside hydrolase family 127 protein, partial [Acidobacteriota bacterium]|nr:glycoside hydrolase family 127 protein [Acidobacteriota bacterium]